MVEELAKEYSQYFRETDISKEIGPICSTIDQMLIRLEEFEALMSTVKNEAALTTQRHVPELLGRQAEFEKLCTQIDNVERLVGVVGANLNAVEEHVVIAEEELGINALGLKGLFMPILGAAMKRLSTEVPSNSPAKCRESYEPPAVFRASDYFKGTVVESVAEGSGSAPDHRQIDPVDLSQFEI